MNSRRDRVGKNPDCKPESDGPVRCSGAGERSSDELRDQFIDASAQICFRFRSGMNHKIWSDDQSLDMMRLEEACIDTIDILHACVRPLRRKTSHGAVQRFELGKLHFTQDRLRRCAAPQDLESPSEKIVEQPFRALPSHAALGSHFAGRRYRLALSVEMNDPALDLWLRQ